MFHRLLMGEQFGEGESTCGTVVFAEQIQTFDGREDSFGDRVAAFPGDQHAAIARAGDVADVHLNGRHTGEPKKIPGAPMGAAVQ